MFDGSDPFGRVTQMEDYFSFHEITDELMKLRVGVLYWIQKVGNCGNDIKRFMPTIISYSHFVKAIYVHFEKDNHYFG